MDYSADLHAVARLVAAPLATEEVLSRGLEALGRVVPYDLAAIFRLDGEGGAHVIAAAGRLDTPKVRRHCIELQHFPTIQRALALRRPIALEAHHHASPEGDPYDGVLDFPHGHSCMVVPLFAGERNLGLVTIDRQVCGSYPPDIVELAGVYGQLMALALHLSDLGGTLDRYRYQLSEHNRLVEESHEAHQAITSLEASREPAMRELIACARQVAVSAVPVLVLGETGTGKEIVAQAIHAWSARATGPFVKLNCSAIPENLVESELFGHVRGAFSGADRPRQGRFLTANGGSLLLDEIGDMPLTAQAKLLRVLQEGTFEPVGSDRTVKVDVRVIAATHRDLEQAVSQGRFREDLYYRLAVFPLLLPPLRERRSDISLIAQGFLEREQRRTGRGPWTLSDDALELLKNSRWPGNVRELVNALGRAIILKPQGLIEERHLARRQESAPPSSPAPSERLPSWKENEKRYLEELTRATEGRLYGPRGAAEFAKLKPTTLRSKLLKHGLR